MRVSHVLFPFAEFCNGLVLHNSVGEQRLQHHLYHRCILHCAIVVRGGWNQDQKELLNHKSIAISSEVLEILGHIKVYKVARNGQMMVKGIVIGAKRHLQIMILTKNIINRISNTLLLERLLNVSFKTS